MTQHTPGPWRVGREIGESQLMPRIEILRDVTFVEGVRPTTYYLAEVCYPTTTGNTVGAEERRANARLIAAAPQLLEACQTVINVVHSTEGRCMAADGPVTPTCDEITDDELRAMYQAARAAIAAATGTPT